MVKGVNKSILYWLTQFRISAVQKMEMFSLEDLVSLRIGTCPLSVSYNNRASNALNCLFHSKYENTGKKEVRHPKKHFSVNISQDLEGFIYLLKVTLSFKQKEEGSAKVKVFASWNNKNSMYCHFFVTLLFP